MAAHRSVLACWHSERAGLQVLESALDALRTRKVAISSVLYLVQKGRRPEVPATCREKPVEVVPIDIANPTAHREVHDAVRRHVVDRLAESVEVHINVSPGTPAMHAVWLVLHAGGAFPEGTRLWSSQLDPATHRTRIDPVEFDVSTYLAEIRRARRADPEVAAYETTALSANRRQALERLARYARVPGAPLLILGERGTGKTRIVETHVATLKRRKSPVTVACGGLDTALADSLLFGHTKGAFTGAESARKGMLAEANGRILFLDEVQDLPQPVQRKIVRVFQDRHRRFRPLGSDREESVDVELVCASNLTLDALRERLDADLFDRLSHLSVQVPPLRECREDVPDDWGRVWRELRLSEDLPVDAPWSEELGRRLEESPLPGNLRDLQRLALLVMAWLPGNGISVALKHALAEWTRESPDVGARREFHGPGTRRERVRRFQGSLARWAKIRFGTWEEAAKELVCDEKTLRQDASAAQE